MSSKSKGIFYILIAALFFAGMSACVRLAGELPSFEKAFFRNFVAAIAAWGTIRRKGTPLHIPKPARLFVLGRALFGTIGLSCHFYAIDRLTLADANMLNKLSPFFAILFSYFLLKEKIRPVQAIAVLGAFIGAMFIVKPGGAELQVLPAIIGLCGGIAAGAAYTCLRRATLSGTQGPIVVLCFSCFSCLTLLPLMLMDFVMPTVYQLAMLLLCGLCATIAQFSITAAYTCAPAREISVYDYSQVIFAAIIGFFLFDQVPDVFSFAGYALIIAMAVLNYWYNNHVVKE